MKKLLFVCYGLGIGGIEKCLVNLINILPENEFSVDLLLMNPEYDLKHQLRRKVNILDRFRYVMNTTDTENEIKTNGGYLRNIPILFRYIMFRVSVKTGGRAWKWFKSIPDSYDVAIAYSHHDYSPFFVIDKVQAKRKVLWYHNGKYENTGKALDRDKQYFSKFHYIVAVSTDCAKELRCSFPDESSRIIVLKNICDVQSIKENSNSFIPDFFDNTRVNIVTVGRLTKEKGANIALDVCCQLHNRKYPVIWHWIGDGNQREKIEKEIEKRGINGIFVLEGNQDNPYPFIRYCDIYVQTSYYEAYSTTITEAKVLNKPIVTTDVGGMRDQITDGINGSIVPIDSNALANKIGELIDEKMLRQKYIDSLSEYNVDNLQSIKEYYHTIFS